MSGLSLDPWAIAGQLWKYLTAHPTLLVIVVLVVVVIVSQLYLRVRWAHLALKAPDPTRRFHGSTRSLILSRAGNRCEHRFLFLIRCPSRKDLEADHIHPHSKGGGTTITNGQALCAFHNRAKGARVPYTWELRLLRRARERYFPPGTNGPIVRRGKPFR